MLAFVGGSPGLHERRLGFARLVPALLRSLVQFIDPSFTRVPISPASRAAVLSRTPRTFRECEAFSCFVVQDDVVIVGRVALN